MTTQPPPIDRDALRKLADAATPGPWEARVCPPCAERGWDDVQVWDQAGEALIAQWLETAAEAPHEDAEFIAASRTTVPALLDKLDESNRELIELREELRVARGAGAKEVITLLEESGGDYDFVVWWFNQTYNQDGGLE